MVLFLSLFFCLLHGLLQHISQGVSHSLVTVNLYLLKKGFSFCLPLEPGTKMSYCVIHTLFFDPRHSSALSLVLLNFVHLSVSIAPNKLLGSFFYLEGDFALYSKSRGEFSSTVGNFVIIVPPYSGIHSTSSRCHARTRRCHKNACLWVWWVKNFLFLFYRNSSISIETFTLSARLRHLTDGDFEFVIAQKRI